MKRSNFFTAVLFLVLTSIFLFPLKDGLLLLPLDLLVSNYGPWYMAGQILLKNPYMQDAVLQYFPWHHLVFESFKNGLLPFWNPYQMMGMPFMAGMKPMVFYPLNILFIFGEVWQWHASIFLQIFLSMVFVYVLARDFKISRKASVLSAVSFSLSSLMIGLSQFVSDSHAILWFPLFILFAKRFLDGKSAGWRRGRYLFFMGISVAFSIFAGHLQYTGYGLILLGAFILYYGSLKKIKLRSYVYLFSSIILGILLSSVQLIPALEFFLNSSRGISHSHFVFSADLLSPNQLFRLFSPDFFGHPTQRNLTSGYIESSGYFGIISFFFALYAIIYARKNPFVKFFAVFFVVAAILALKGPAAEMLYFLKVPLLTSGSGGRIFGLAMLSGSLLAGFGFDEILRGKIRRNILALLAFTSLFGLGILLNYKRPLFFHDIQFSLAIFGVFVLLSCIYFFIKRGESTKFSRATAMLTLVPWKSITAQLRTRKFSWATSALPNIFALFLLSLIFFDLFRFGYRYFTFSNEKFLYPETKITKAIKENSQSTLSRSFGITEPEIGTYLGLYSLETYNPFYPQRSAKLLQVLQKLPTNVVPTDNKYYLNTAPNLKYALDFTGVSFVAVPKGSNPSYYYFNTGNFEASFDKILEDEALDLYQNKDALPRFGLFYQYKIAKSEDQLKIINARSFDPKSEILLEEELPIKLAVGTGSAKLFSSDINSQKFSIETDKSALFYISDTYFPGWKAKVNNKESKIYRANYNFRAVLVPQESSTIEFSYLPTHFPLAVAISLLSLFLLTLLAFINKPPKKSRGNDADK